jgi:D-erythrulose 4-kinase
MTRLWNDPRAFADEMVDGFVAANGRWVKRVTGGVSRARPAAPRTVALVIGGGSGHYPAFGGLVGPGLAAGAAMGNLFASPSPQQVMGVAKASERGGGVLLSYGNYAGDVLNFDAAQRALVAEGYDVRTVVVTDDIASAPLGEKARRRGIAGDLCVFKVAGAAAERGWDLDRVADVALRANDRTRSFGVAFSGCSLPGMPEPLFSVPEGRMAIGMGIHGERGLDEADVPTANDLAEMLVARLLAESPEDSETPRGSRVVPILNGLGSVKYEELFVVFRRVRQLLVDAGLAVVEPEVGELVTSFDMAGVSLTLLWLDAELEALWADPAETPAFRKGSIRSAVDASEMEAFSVIAVHQDVPDATPESAASASRALLMLSALRAAIDDDVAELGRLDSIAGDGDHGIGMQRGAQAAEQVAADAVARGAGIGTVLRRAGDAWGDRAGGTSGAIWGTALAALGAHIGDEHVPDAAAVSAAVHAATEAILDFGAHVGDKTVVDAVVPFDEELRRRVDGGSGLAAAWAAAADAARGAAFETATLLPRMGRARTHADRAVGTPDPGAISFALIVEAVQPVLSAPSHATPSGRTSGE